MQLSRLILITALATQLTAFAGSLSSKSSAPVQPATSSSFADAGSLAEYFFGKDNAWDSTFDSVQQWKKDNNFPISIGAHHWWRVDRDAYLYGNGYGAPGERGTFYYWLNVAPSIKLSGDGFVKEVGIHAQGRIRDSSDKLRAFYDDTVWSYEAYVFAKTDAGTFKAGQIVQNFCLAWDNSWYEGVTYFDEYRFNPSYGFSWEKTWKASESFSMDTSAQYFIRGDHVSGALVNSSAATTKGAQERNTGIVRMVPTWKLDNDNKIAWGVAGLVRGIDANSKLGLDDTQVAYETDLTLTHKNLSIWAQYIDSHGVITPARYVSGGPSDRQNSISTGINYKIGPISAHVNYSKGWDHNPGGHQYIFQPGITFQLAKNLTLYTEYVKWNVTGSSGATAKYEDGFQFALVWNY